MNKNFWKSKKVLVTGHTGFKGSWLLLLLKDLGSEVWGYSLEAEQNDNLFSQISTNLGNSFHHIVGDIRDYKKLLKSVKTINPDIVIHLAAQSLVKYSYKHPLNTYEVNLMGSLYLIEALKGIEKKCAVVMVTTDKVYENKESVHGYRENDRLGGYDPYSSSKACAEIAISSWRSSFCKINSIQKTNLLIATARSGNVIGGGDWAIDRIIPDYVKSIINRVSLNIRYPDSIRPWQHVLEPLNGYLKLAEYLYQTNNPLCEAYNFGPNNESNRTVLELIESISKDLPGEWINIKKERHDYETKVLKLQIDKSLKYLDWEPLWNFEMTVSKTGS